MKEDEDEICMNMKNCTPINICARYTYIFDLQHISHSQKVEDGHLLKMLVTGNCGELQVMVALIEVV